MNCCVVPFAMLGFNGVTSMETSAGMPPPPRIGSCPPLHPVAKAISSNAMDIRGLVALLNIFICFLRLSDASEWIEFQLAWSLSIFFCYGLAVPVPGSSFATSLAFPQSGWMINVRDLMFLISWIDSSYEIERSKSRTIVFNIIISIFIVFHLTDDPDYSNQDDVPSLSIRRTETVEACRRSGS